MTHRLEASVSLTKCYATLVVLLLVSGARAEIQAISVDSYPSVVAILDFFSSDDQPTGFVVNDIQIDFANLLGEQQVFLELSSGFVYNTRGFGGNVANSSVFFGLVPALAEDSFVTIAAENFDEYYVFDVGVQVLGGAVDIAGAPAEMNVGTPDDSVVSARFGPAPGDSIADQLDMLIAKLTLSNDASGTIIYRGLTLESDEPYWATGSVRDGVVSFVPEPASLAMLVIAGVGWRRSRQ